MPIVHLFPVDVMNTVPEKEKPEPPTPKLSPSSFNFGDSPVPAEWKERLSKDDGEERSFLLQ